MGVQYPREDSLPVVAHKPQDQAAQDHAHVHERGRGEGDVDRPGAGREFAHQRRAGGASDFATKAAAAVVMLNSDLIQYATEIKVRADLQRRRRPKSRQPARVTSGAQRIGRRVAAVPGTPIALKESQFWTLCTYGSQPGLRRYVARSALRGGSAVLAAEHAASQAPTPVRARGRSPARPLR